MVPAYCIPAPRGLFLGHWATTALVADLKVIALYWSQAGRPVPLSSSGREARSSSPRP